MEEMRSARLRTEVVWLATVGDDPGCVEQARQLGVRVTRYLEDLLNQPGLDLILCLSNDRTLLKHIVANRPPTVGVLDPVASQLFLEIAALDQQSARREADISLASSFATAMLEASPDAVMVIDRDHRIVRCNNHPLITGGGDRSEIEGRACFQVLHGALSPCAGPERECPMQQTLNTGLPARSMHEIITRNGETRICHVTTYPLKNRFGEIMQVVDVIRDITNDISDKINERTQALKDDMARFVQEDRLISLGRLVASVCHEINNPILSIVTFNKLLLSQVRQGTLTPENAGEAERYLELSVREALRCGDIVKNLLSFARQKKVEAGEIDLKEMVDTIATLTDHQAQSSNVKIILDLPRDRLAAWGDQPQIQQCVMNLVFNALEAMPGGGELRIRGGRAQDHDQGVWLSVSDTGAGIAADQLNHIFEPFYSTKGEMKGVGLGLSMVYGIISEHRGSIRVDSRPGEGSTFRITLPAAPSPAGKESADA